MSGLIAKKGISFIAADAVESGWRNMLIGDPHQMLQSVKFEVWAECKTSIQDAGDTMHFTKESNESALTQLALAGMLDHYARNRMDVAVEGGIITPEWVASLRLPGIPIKAAFVGYINPTHADSIIAHSKDNPHDWINEWLQDEQGDETRIKDWVKRQTVKCEALKAEAESRGYPFFDISTQSFDDYVAYAQNYFMQT